MENFKKEAIKKLGDKYDVHVPKKRLPKIKIMGISEKLTSEEIATKAVNQNLYIKEESHMKVFAVVKQRRSNRYIAYAEVDPDTYKRAVQEETINIGWDRCKVFDALNVTRCYNCNGFNHKAKECRSSQSCPRCGKNHDINDCKATETEIQCINCKTAMDKLKIKLDVGHCAWSAECSVYKRKLEIERSKIDFLG